MAFNSFARIETKISKICDAIYDSYDINCVQIANIYEVFFVSYKNSKIKTYQKIHKHSLIKLWQKSKKLQFVSILIEKTRSTYMLARR